MKWLRRISIGFLIFVLVAYLALRTLGPKIADQMMNGLTNPKPLLISERAKKLHSKLFIADLHADPLLFGRDLRKRGETGHIDFPRMREGGMTLQVFSVVSKTPHNLNIDHNDDKTDDIFWLGFGSGWPIRTWFSLKERTVYLGSRLQKYSEDGSANFQMIRNKKEFSDFLSARENDKQRVAGLLSIEGLHALEGKLENIEVLDKTGFRLIGLAHFFDNEVSGSAHGMHKGGLTAFGKEVVKNLESRKILVDVAHSSHQTIDEVLKMASRPVVISHTGVKATCDNNRNLSDAQIKAVAATGGVIGIGFWDTATCGTNTQSIAKAIQHAVSVVGPNHVGLGSDFDGSVSTPFDVTGLIQVTQALIDAGMSDSAIEAVMGGNVKRLLQTSLPD